MLKNRLSEYVRLAAGGEAVLVLDRERVVAELGPPGLHRGRNITDERMAEAVRAGAITAPVARLTRPPRRTPVALLADLLRELHQDREDR